MGLLSENVTTGKKSLPHLVLLHALDGVGKSTFASKAPNPIFIGPEKGTMNLNVSRIESIDSWKKVSLCLEEIAKEKHGYETLVIDTIDWLEPILYKHICEEYGVKHIEKASGGYGKGYKEAFANWIEFCEAISFIRETRNMNVIFLAHSCVKEFNDPATERPYHRYELKLHESNNVNVKALFREYVDSVLFAKIETYTKGEGKESRGITTRERKMYTEYDAAFDAKSRYNIPFELPLEWEAYTNAVNHSRDDGSRTIRSIERIIKSIEDVELKKKASEQFKIAKDAKDIKRLEKIHERLKTATGRE